MARYRGRAACPHLPTVAAIATLLVPIAVRRMIDFGFTAKGVELIDSYFTVMIAVVAVLACASALRFYLVTTIGERIVADLRRDVFAHLISLSPAFFDSARSGEMVSRLTADTTQIKSAVGASVSIALRNLVLFVGAAAMMVVTSPRLSAFVLGAIPVIVDPAGGIRALGAAAVAQRPGTRWPMPRRMLPNWSARSGPCRPLPASLGHCALSAARSNRPAEAARSSTRARAVLASRSSSSSCSPAWSRSCGSARMTC